MSSRLTKSLRDTVLSFCRSLSGQSTKRRRRSVWNSSASEALEGRRMPATLIGTTQVKYQDIDGDDVLALAVLKVRGDDVEAVRCERDGASVEEFSSSWSV